VFFRLKCCVNYFLLNLRYLETPVLKKRPNKHTKHSFDITLLVKLPALCRMKANLIGHNLRRNSLLKYFSEGKMEGNRRRRRRCKRLLNDLKEKKILELERENARLQLLENSSIRLYTCRNTNYRVNNYINFYSK